MVRFQTEIEQKPHKIQRQFSQNVTFFYARHILFLFGCFLWKKWTKVEILRVWSRKPLILHINWKRKKSEILTKLEQKPKIIQGQFSKNITLFMRGASSLFCCFLSKIRTKGEISDRIWAKTPYNTVTIFTKCSVFYASYMVKT